MLASHIFLFVQCLGYVCSLESGIISFVQRWKTDLYEPVAEDPSMNLQERQMSLHDSPEHLKLNQTTTTTHNYKPIVYNPPQAASTSRHEPINYLDDVQPCSSKSSDPYRVA